MERLVGQQARKIAEALSYDAEKEAVIRYGLLAIVQIVVTLVLVFLFGLLVGAPVQALIICLAVSILRKYSGGVHADNVDFCTIFSVIYCTVTSVISIWLAGAYSQWWMLSAITLVYAASFYIAYRYVPVDSPNKPIKSAQKIKRMRRGSFLILGVYTLISVTFFLLSSRVPVFQSYGIGLLFGVSWQVLTLTPLGAILLHKLNDLPTYLREENNP